jgi:hypothetical protein
VIQRLYTLGSYSEIKGGIAYEWVLVDRHGVPRASDVASRGAGTWAVHKTWECATPPGIRLNIVQSTERCTMRGSVSNARCG